MNNSWREMGFIVQRKPKVHLKIVRAKKRLRKCTKKFKEGREKLMLLQLRNRIHKFIIEELERKLAKIDARKINKNRLKTMKSSKPIK